MRSLEECAEVVLRKWPIACDAEDWGVRTVTPADLLADDDGRPSKWLWALWSKRVGWLTPPDFEGDKWCCTTGPNERIQGLGDTATEAITRALCALAEAS